jgi:RNA polymerase sigma-70 factor, ECF subfamily
MRVVETLAVREDVGTDRVRVVYESDHARLWRSLYAFTSSRAIADDAAAEAFAQALRRGDEIRDVQAWVWRAAYAIARGELKRRSSDHPLAETMIELQTDGVAELLGRLGAMSDGDRELIVLCHVGGWKPDELARATGVPSGVLRVRLHRATRRARDLLSEEGS